MSQNSLFFCIPQLIVQVTTIVQSLQQGTIELPDGPNIVLVCQNIEQTILINEKILRGREIGQFINIDLVTQPASFGVFFDIKDNRGIDLSAEEVELLCSMTAPSYRPVSNAGNSKTTRIMFGNGVDIQDNELQILIEGKKKFGKFNIVVGYDMGSSRAMFTVPIGRQPLIVECAGDYTTDIYDKFLNNCLHKFSDE